MDINVILSRYFQTGQAYEFESYDLWSSARSSSHHFKFVGYASGCVGRARIHLFMFEKDLIVTFVWDELCHELRISFHNKDGGNRHEGWYLSCAECNKLVDFIQEAHTAQLQQLLDESHILLPPLHALVDSYLPALRPITVLIKPSIGVENVFYFCRSTKPVREPEIGLNDKRRWAKTQYCLSQQQRCIKK